MPKRIVEYPSRGWRQIEIEYEEGQFIDELERSIRLLEGDLVEVEGESSYEGWQRLVINVSPVLEEEERSREWGREPPLRGSSDDGFHGA